MTTARSAPPSLTTLLGGLPVERFLADHWQKRPLLIRNAWPGFAPPLSPDELAGLACEEDVEARLVLKRTKAPYWELRHGPFAERDFARLPERDWTLLVQDVDKHLPDAARVLEPFRFIPDWRIDDLMISYAVEGGGVGPHVDQYDVFLLQAHGRRRWRIAPRQPEWHEIPGLELRVLETFEAQDEWILEPGDMLYLPPGVAHEGTALGECMTCSIGFRAPSARELVSDLAEWLYQRIPEDARYADPELAPEDARPAGRIAPRALASVRRIVRTQLNASDAELDEWFGRFITEPKPHLRPEPADQPLDPEAIAQDVLAGAPLVREPRSLFAWIESQDRTLTLFVDGTSHPVPSSLAGLVELLCARRHYPPALLKPWLADPCAKALLAALYVQGALYFEPHV